MTATDTPTSQAVERVDSSPRAMVQRYQQSFADVLPSHIQRPETWIRLAQGALKKGNKDPRTGMTDLETAATNNPGVFLAALLDCARLGLEPGTEQYYLTPRKVKGRLEILGIVGYQGHIELMYRAGAISSVVAECVYTGDTFEFNPGRDEIPRHEIDWDAEDRGDLRLAYAFARMKDGATSKVVVLNRAAINRIKASSQGASSEYSPWVKHPDAMWLKSAVRQLSKWVPTSAEYVREQLRVQAELNAEAGLPSGATADSLGLPALPDTDPELDPVDPDQVTDEFDDDDEIADAELIDEPEMMTVSDGDYEGAGSHQEPAPADLAPDPVDLPTDPMTENQSKALHALLRKAGGVGETRFPIISNLLGREVTSTKQLSKAEASLLIDALQPEGAPEAPSPEDPF